MPFVREQSGGTPDSFSITLRLAVAPGYAPHAAYMVLTEEQVTLLKSMGYNYMTAGSMAKTAISTGTFTIAYVSTADVLATITFSKE